MSLLSDITLGTLNHKEVQSVEIDSAINVSNATEIQVLKAHETPHCLNIELAIRVPTVAIEKEEINITSLPSFKKKPSIFSGIQKMVSSRSVVSDTQQTQYKSTVVIYLLRIAVPILLHSLAHAIPTASVHEVMENIRNFFDHQCRGEEC